MTKRILSMAALISILLSLGNLRCEKEIKIREITGIKCFNCAKVFSAETTVIPISLKDAKRKAVKTSEGNFLFKYKNILCANCRQQSEIEAERLSRERKIEAEKLYREGRKAYGSKDYTTAEQKFRMAIDRNRGHKEAATWYKKTWDRIFAIRKAEAAKEEAKKEKLMAADRKAYAKVVREIFLDHYMDVKVWVSGKNNIYLHMEYPLFNDVWMHQFEKDEWRFLFVDFRKTGFKRVYFTDGWDYSIYYNL